MPVEVATPADLKDLEQYLRGHIQKVAGGSSFRSHVLPGLQRKGSAAARVHSMMFHIVRGFKNLPGYGYHPGVGIFVLLVAFGLLGASWLGATAVIVVFGPMLCYGAYTRSRDYGA